MKMLFKQRLFSWFDSYNIYDERENVLFTVDGKIAIGHKLHILDAGGRHIATVREKPISWMPCFRLYVGEKYIGCIRRKFKLFGRRYVLDFNGWEVSGDFFGWDYAVTDASGGRVASVGKELFRLTDTYVIDVTDPKDALYALMIVLSIDADNCDD